MPRALVKVLYWLAVVAISLVLLVALVLFFESRDDSGVEEGRAQPSLTLAALRF